LKKLKSHPHLKIFQNILEVLPINVATLAILDTTFFAYFECDFLSITINILHPRPFSLVKALGLFSFRFMWLIHSSYILVIFILGCLEFVIFMLFIAEEMFFHLNAWVDYNTKFYATAAIYKVKNSKCRLPRFIKILQLNSQVKLFEQLANNALYYYLPFLLLFGGFILISSNFACVKFHSKMPMPVFVFMPVLSIFVIIIILTLFPAATKVHDDSCRCLHKLGLLAGKQKYFSKRVKAQRPFRFNFGPLFMAKNSTKTTYLACVIDGTINALLISG